MMSAAGAMKIQGVERAWRMGSFYGKSGETAPQGFGVTVKYLRRKTELFGAKSLRF
jgi:hypothetical protein